MAERTERLSDSDADQATATTSGKLPALHGLVRTPRRRWLGRISPLTAATAALPVAVIAAMVGSGLASTIALGIATLALGAVAGRLLTQLGGQPGHLASKQALADLVLANMDRGFALFDAHERIVMANARFAELFRLDPAETRPGTSLRQILELRRSKGLSTGFSTEQELRRLRSRSIIRKTSTLIARFNDGRTIHTTLRPGPDNGWLTTHQDITDRIRLEETERQAKETLAAVINAAPLAIICLAPDRRVLVWSRGAELIFGYTAQETVGRPYKLVPSGQDAEYDDLFRRALNGEIFRDRLIRRRHKDGHLIDISFSSAAMHDADGTLRGIAYALNDITEYQRLNAQLEQQNHLLQQREEQLGARNAQLDAALNNMVQGLAMFDADLRVVLANDRYAEMYGLAPQDVLPGTALAAIVERHAAAATSAGVPGFSLDMLRPLLARLSERCPGHYTTALADGRCVAVSLQPMPNGGTVTTHQDITEQRRSEAKIVHMALHDTLTNLPNRVLFNERLEHALTRVKRGEVVAVHMLDLDHFKTVNDTLGHPVGDALLKMVAERLTALVRETDTIARMGGDEFAIVQIAISHPADATSLARRAIQAISRPYEIEGQQIVIGTSVGIALGPDDGLAPDQLIRNADLALYRAKGEGRGAWRFFEEQMDAQMQARRTLEYDLRRALVAEEFELHYQPVVNIKRNEITGLEALVRWRHPRNGLVAPGRFIPLAEETGLIIPLGEWALKKACHTAAAWPGDLAISVNVSPAQFRSHGLVAAVTDALAASALAPERLELEITEQALVGDTEATLATLHKLRDIGVRIAMDDFGTGYSSLNYLQSFPFDCIKIDRSFISDMLDGIGSLNIVRAVMAMANGLGMTTIAEGVETEDQLEAVRAEGCTQMQGFVFSKPLPAADVERLLASRAAPRLRRSAGDAA